MNNSVKKAENVFEYVKTNDVAKTARKEAENKLKSISSALALFKQYYTDLDAFKELKGRYNNKFSVENLTPLSILEAQTYLIYEGENLIGIGKKSNGEIVLKDKFTIHDMFLAWRRLNTGGYKQYKLQRQTMDIEMTVFDKDVNFVTGEKLLNEKINAKLGKNARKKAKANKEKQLSEKVEKIVNTYNEKSINSAGVNKLDAKYINSLDDNSKEILNNNLLDLCAKCKESMKKLKASKPTAKNTERYSKMNDLRVKAMEFIKIIGKI